MTEGLGVKREEAYPSLLEKRLIKEGFLVQVINAGVSGSTSATALGRLKTYLKQEPDFLILALGANDGLRGLSMENMERNLSRAIKLASSNGIRVILAGMRIPTNLGEDYTNAFASVFDRLENTHQIIRIPFLLEGVAGLKEMNLADGIHPNSRGHEIIAQNLYPILAAALKESQNTGLMK